MKKGQLMPWKIIQSKLVFDHLWYKLRQDTVQLPNGSIIDDYFVSEREDVAVILAITKEGKAITVTQYKHGAGAIVTELPAGFFNKDELALDAAKRELLEETGFASENWTLLAQTRDNPTKDNNHFYLFLAQECEKVAEQHLDESEEIVLDFIAVDDLPMLIAEGTIHVHSMISTIYLGLKKLGNSV
jgi:ADP-ribose pyrophosphatase